VRDHPYTPTQKQVNTYGFEHFNLYIPRQWVGRLNTLN
jgi:hypothetical protein